MVYTVTLVSNSGYIMSDDGQVINNDCGRTQSWPNLRHCPGICLEELRKISGRTVGMTVKI